jgi:hypothetical protein
MNSDDSFSVSVPLAGVVGVEVGVARTGRGSGRLVLQRRSDRRGERCEEDGGCE